MRARAIRSLLKKEEAVQAQKVLSEYKDEPDDLIPVEIEPPHIELLSDSEGEETTDINVIDKQESMGTEKLKEGLSSKQGDDSLQNTEDQDSLSKSLLNLSNDESNSASGGKDNMAICSDRSGIINDDTANGEDKSAESVSSQDVMKSCKGNENLSAINDRDPVQCAPSNVVIPAKADELTDSSHTASQISSASIPCVSECKLDEDSIDQDSSKTSCTYLKKIDQTSFTSNDSENNIDTGHFLVVEEPSMTDGSKIDEFLDVTKKPNVGTTKPSSNLDDEFEQSEPFQLVDSFFVDEELQHPPVANCSQIGLNSKLAAVEKNTIGPLDTTYVVPTTADAVANTKDHVVGYRSCLSTYEANLALPTPVSSKTTGGIIKDDLDSQFEDEVLDYDYNPVNSVQMAEAAMTLSSENNCSEGKLDKVECISHKAGNNCGVYYLLDKPETTFLNTAEDEGLSSDDLSSASNRLHGEKKLSDNCSVTESIAHSVLSNDSNKKSSSTAESLSGLVLGTSKPEDDVRTNIISSPVLLRDSERLAQSVGGPGDDIVQQNTIYEEELTLKDHDPHTPPLIETTHLNHGTCGHSLNTQARCVVSKDEFPMNERGIPEAECSGQYQHKQNLASQHPDFNSGSAQTLDVSLTLEENISSVDKDQIISGGCCVTAPYPAVDMNCLMIEQSSAIIHVQKPEKIGFSESLLSSRPDHDANVVISTVMYKQPPTIMPGDISASGSNLSPIANQSESIANDIIKGVQGTDCTLFATGSTVESSNSEIQSSEILDLSEDVDIVDEAIGVQIVQISGKSCELQNPTPRNLINSDVAEIIDITDGEQLNNSEVEYVGEESVDSDSLDVSDNEISDKAALILEQMNTILNEGADGMGDSSSGGSYQSSPNVACEIPAEILSVNSDNSELVTDDDNEDNAMPEESRKNSYLDVVDLDDASEEESSGSKEEGTSDSNDDDCSDGSQNDSIEIIYDSESACSVESQEIGSKSNESVTAMQPDTTISDDCIMVTEPECTNYCNSVVLIEPSGSESDDCAIVSLPDDPIASEKVPKSSMTVKSPSIVAAKDTVITRMEAVTATIVIEDDDGEEVQLLTKEVPAEIFELDDDDELKSNWTARWLESDNVKKVVKTSKILANVRKQMKMKLKKVEDPVIEDPKPSTEKSAPPLIGSVEEYHRLVKEGVIFSKVPDNNEIPESSKASCFDAFKKSTDVFLESSVQVVAEEKSNRKNPVKKKKTERKKKSGLSKNPDHPKKTNSDKPLLDPSVLKSPTDVISKEIPALPNVNKKREISTIAADDTGQEDGEIFESTKSKLSDDIGCWKAETQNNGKSVDKVENDKIYCTEQSSKKYEGGEELEEGEICDKEEGEISDSDDDSKESHNSSHPKSSSFLKECNSRASPLSSIPLPQKPPVKLQSTKTPERSSVAKRIILRSLQLGRKKPANSKNKKKRKKGAGGGNKKGLGCSSNVAPKKNKLTSLPSTKGVYEQPLSLTSTGSSFQAVTDSQPSYLTAYPGLAQPGSVMSQQGQAHNTNTVASNTAQMYDSYYSWAYSQGLISSGSGNYGYGTPESISDPNVYKQWEEYYRKLMEACKVSAEHASAGTLYNASSTSTTEKSGYTWVFDHSASATEPSQIQTVADSTTEPSVQVPATSLSSDVSKLSQDVVPITNEMSDKERFECWQYRYGLKGLLKEHFVPAPGAPSSGDGNQKL